MDIIKTIEWIVFSRRWIHARCLSKIRGNYMKLRSRLKYEGGKAKERYNLVYIYSVIQFKFRNKASICITYISAR